jgi:hypothetical protein
MSTMLTNAAIARGPKKAGPLLVLWALTDNANDYGEASLRIDAIARKSRMTERNAINVLKKLEAEVWITSEKRAVPRMRGQFRKRGGSVNRYQINLEKLGVGARFSPEIVSREKTSPETVSHENRSRETAACVNPVEKPTIYGGKPVKGGWKRAS